MKQKVALVLASGGAKGFAHIGAIEVLEHENFEVASVAGTSMGALIGGIYAAGGLGKVKEWMYSLSRGKIFSLMDFTLSTHSLLKGNKLMDALQALVPDQRIEDLPIPYCAVATDIKTGEEIVIREGSLFEAIRASISLPLVFTPVEDDDRLLIDGGITNGLPLNRVSRTEGDLLVAINLEDYEWDEPTDTGSPRLLSLPFFGKVRTRKSGVNANYLTMLYRSLSIAMKKNAELMVENCRPDIYLNVDMHEFGSFDYDQARAIAALGRDQMRAAVKRYKASVVSRAGKF